MIQAFEKSKKGIYLVAEQNGRLVGHAFLNPLPLKSLAHVAALSIGVHLEWQDKGIGQMLIRQLIEWARENSNLEKIELNVRASSERALALYRKMEFIEERRLKKRVKISESNYIDDIIMALHLA